MSEINTPSLTETFKQSQIKNSRVKEAYSEKESLLTKELKESGFELTNFNMLILATKREQQFKIYLKKKTDTKFLYFKTYDICYLSGILGPKKKKAIFRFRKDFII